MCSVIFSAPLVRPLWDCCRRLKHFSVPLGYEWNVGHRPRTWGNETPPDDRCPVPAEGATSARAWSRKDEATQPSGGLLAATRSSASQGSAEWLQIPQARSSPQLWLPPLKRAVRTRFWTQSSFQRPALSLPAPQTVCPVLGSFRLC